MAKLPKAVDLDVGTFILSQDGHDVCWMHGTKDMNGNGIERWYWNSGFSLPAVGMATWVVRREAFRAPDLAAWRTRYQPLTSNWKRHTIESD